MSLCLYSFCEAQHDRLVAPVPFTVSMSIHGPLEFLHDIDMALQAGGELHQVHCRKSAGASTPAAVRIIGPGKLNDSAGPGGDRHRAPGG